MGLRWYDVTRELLYLYKYLDKEIDNTKKDFKELSNNHTDLFGNRITSHMQLVVAYTNKLRDDVCNDLENVEEELFKLKFRINNLVFLNTAIRKIYYKLNKYNKDLFDMRYVELYSVYTIADKLNVSNEAVKMKDNRLVKKFSNINKFAKYIL